MKWISEQIHFSFEWYFGAATFIRVSFNVRNDWNESGRCSIISHQFLFNSAILFLFLSYFIFFVRLLLLSLCQIFHPIKNTIHSIISLALVVSSIIFLSSFQLIVTFQQHLSYFISFGWVIHSSVIVERNRRENSNNNNKSPDSSSHSNQ